MYKKFFFLLIIPVYFFNALAVEKPTLVKPIINVQSIITFVHSYQGSDLDKQVFLDGLSDKGFEVELLEAVIEDVRSYHSQAAISAELLSTLAPKACNNPLTFNRCSLNEKKEYIAKLYVHRKKNLHEDFMLLPKNSKQFAVIKNKFAQ